MLVVETVMQALDGAQSALPVEQTDPGGEIGGKPVLQLPAIFDRFLREGHWNDGNDPTSYSIPITLPVDYQNGQGDPEEEGVHFSPLSAIQADAVHFAMDILDSIVALDFAFAGNDWNADIRFMNTEWLDGWAHGYPPDAFGADPARAGDVWIHTNVSNNFDMDVGGVFTPVGSQAVMTLVHEIGHTMALSHPSEYDASDAEDPTYEDDAGYVQDSQQYTLMSYFGAVATQADFGNLGPPDSYLLHDIYALQREYGAEMTTRSGNTTYGFNSNAGDIYDLTVNNTPHYAIWDAGGFDTIDLSLANGDVEIDLRPGSFSSFSGGVNNIAIAYDLYATEAWMAWIEAARGGNGRDTLRGNDAENFLYGGNANDRLYGGDASDALYGEDGRDRLEGGDDADALHGGEGNDTLLGQEGDDDLRGGNGNDSLDGGEGADTLRGGDGDDFLLGDVGLDRFEGGAGLDAVDLRYSDQDWTVNLAAGSAGFGAGNEVLISIEAVSMGDGNDTIQLAAADGRALTGGGDDEILRADGNHTVDGGTGWDIYDYGTSAHGVRVDLRVIVNQKVVDLAGTANDRFDRVANIERLEGSNHADTLTAAHGANDLAGDDGDDLLRATGTGDTLTGGEGNDTLVSGNGDDLLAGGNGFDMLSLEYATAGVALAIGNASLAIPGLGTDSWSSIEALRGSAHADTLHGTDEQNRLEGGTGHDRLYARGGHDTVTGGSGNDWIETDNVTALAQGDDLAYGGTGADTILSSFGDDTLLGEDQNDSLSGGSGHNDLYGGDGADTMSAGTGNDQFFGGDGTDFVDYRAIGGPVAINLDQAIQNPLGAGFDELDSIEGLIGTGYGDILWGHSNGWSRLYGAGGNDELRGGTGADLLSGDAGNDTIAGLGGGDTIGGGSGRDLARFDFAEASLIINLELTGTQITGAAGPLRITGIEDLIGGDFNDTLAGNSSANDLHGGEGDDRLFGRDGHDRLYGGDGADTLDGGAGNNSLYGEGGVDTASYETASSGVLADLGAFGVQFTWGSGWDLLSSIANLTGSSHDDILRGSIGANEIRDLGGHDWVQAGSDNDTVFAGSYGADTYDGETGSDLISYADQTMAVMLNLAAGTASGLGIFFDDVLNFEHAAGGAGADTITGANGSNRLEGGAGNDSILGGNGNDTITGGTGNDRLNGGAGADHFVFDKRDGSDRVQDFELGVDKLRFTAGPQAFDELVFGAFGNIIAGETTIQLTGVNLATLTEADFIFG